jgi:predicted AAA+ superfamily ATPase
LFENYCIAELNKQIANYDLDLKLWFFRDSHGNEVDIVIEKGAALVPIEIKSALGFSSSFLNGIRYWNEATGAKPRDLSYTPGETTGRGTCGCSTGRASPKSPKTAARARELDL